MKIISSIFLIFVFSICLVSADDCYYTKEIINSTETKFLPFDNENNQLKEVIVEFDKINDGYGRPLKIINPNEYDLNISLEININIKKADWCSSYESPMNSMKSFNIVVPNNGYFNLDIIRTTKNKFCKNFRFTDPYNVQYNSDGNVQIKSTIKQVNITLCDGKDDGVSCMSPNECGGSFCVEGYCSNTEYCFNNDCKCLPTEIQCKNIKCVLKKVIPLGVAPKCNLSEECILGYIDINSGLCDKSPNQIQIEEQERLKLIQEDNDKKIRLYLFSGIGIIILFVLGLFIYYKIKRVDIELISKKIESKEYELNNLQKEIFEINEQKRIRKQDLKKLDYLQFEINKKKKYIENQYNKITKPYFDKDVLRKVLIVPEVRGDYITWQGYVCFYDNCKSIDNYRYQDLVHIWNWKKHHDRKPRKGYHIHHKDHNKLNNSINNLEEIRSDVHKEKHRKNA